MDDIGLVALSARIGVSVRTLQRYCESGAIQGAYRHRLTKGWFVPFSARMKLPPYRRDRG